MYSSTMQLYSEYNPSQILVAHYPSNQNQPRLPVFHFAVDVNSSLTVSVSLSFCIPICQHISSLLSLSVSSNACDSLVAHLHTDIINCAGHAFNEDFRVKSRTRQTPRSQALADRIGLLHRPVRRHQAKDHQGSTVLTFSID